MADRGGSASRLKAWMGRGLSEAPKGRTQGLVWKWRRGMNEAVAAAIDYIWSAIMCGYIFYVHRMN